MAASSQFAGLGRKARPGLRVVRLGRVFHPPHPLPCALCTHRTLTRQVEDDDVDTNPFSFFAAAAPPPPPGSTASTSASSGPGTSACVPTKQRTHVAPMPPPPQIGRAHV